MAQKLKNNFIFWIVVILIRLVNRLPRPMTLAFGEWLGLFTYVIGKRIRHKTLANLYRAYGQELSSRQRQHIARRCFVTIGRSLIETMRIQNHYRYQMRPDIEVVGEEHLQKAYQRGQGVVVFTGHFGNFELLAAHTAQSGYKTAAIGRELYDKRLDQVLVNNRNNMGIVNVRTDDSPRTILKLLKDGYVIGMLIDTDSFRVAGELTPFFGRPAKTPIGPTQLGLLTKAAFVPLFCLSFPGGKYKIIVGPELVPESYERSRENVYKITCQMTEVIEKTIKACPEQWIWMHNRWHTRPEEDDLDFLLSMGYRF